LQNTLLAMLFARLLPGEAFNVVALTFVVFPTYLLTVKVVGNDRREDGEVKHCRRAK
jgi:hypothetical protein